MTPKRIQRQRTKGWRKPDNCVYVGRGSRWGNPFVVGKNGTAQECVKKYCDWLLPYRHQGWHNTMLDFMLSEASLTEIWGKLSGKNLMCWCKIGEPCHADVLLILAASNRCKEK
jgi:hypothetical protein